jgi:predicted DNA-binding transcriptional regulator AlpA
MPLRKAIKRPKVLEATGWSVPTLYRKMKENAFPKSQKLDPNGAAIIWWEDEVIKWQKGEWTPAAN